MRTHWLIKRGKRKTIKNLGLLTQLYKLYMAVWCITDPWQPVSRSCIVFIAFSSAHTALCKVNEVVCIKLFEPKWKRDYLATRRYDIGDEHDE